MQGGTPAALPESGPIEEMVNKVKAMIKKTVQRVCNDEYRQHHKRESAGEAVKTHLKKVTMHVQARLFKHLVRLQPGQSMTEVPIETIQQSFRSISVELAFRCVKQASQSLVPQFHWLSQCPHPTSTYPSAYP